MIPCSSSLGTCSFIPQHILGRKKNAVIVWKTIEIFIFFFYEPLHEVFLDRRDATEISLISFSSEFEKLVLHSVTSSYKKVHLHGFRHLCFSLELEALIKFIFLIKCALFCFLSFCFSECIWPI